MRKIVSVLRIALVLACIVLAVPTAVSAADPAEASEPAMEAGALYGNGTSFDVCPAENDPLNWLIVWEWDDPSGTVAEKSMEIPADTPIYAGSKDGDVEPDDDYMSITLHGVTVEDLYMCGNNGSVKGEVDLFLEDGAVIKGTLKVDGNELAGIRFGKGTKITNVTGAEGRTDTMLIEFVRESGMTKAALTGLFSGIDIVELFIADIIVGENGSVQGGKIEESTLAYTGRPLLDPDDDEVSDWTPIPNPGYKFDGWYLNGTRIDLFKTPMTEAHLAGAPTDEDGKAVVTVYAKWLPVSHETGMDNMGGVMMALIILTGAVAGITGGILMTRRKSSAR